MTRKPLSKKIRFEVFKRDSFTCQYCGRMSPDVVLEVDHINPVKNGGDNDILNLITSCFDCNRGKGKKELTNKQEIQIQQQQLKELNEKREQLKMMIEWKKELENFEDEQAQEIEKLFEGVCGDFTDYGHLELKKIIKKYGFEPIYECAKIARNNYCNIDSKSKKNIVTYIKRIYINKEKQKNNPNVYKVNYLIKILKNRLRYINEWKIKQCLNELYKEDDFETLKEQFCIIKNWTELKEFFIEFYSWEM